MSPRVHLPSTLAAALTAADLALCAFFLIGLLSERLPRGWQPQVARSLVVLLATVGTVFLLSFALAYRRIVPRQQGQDHAYRWLLTSFAGALLGFGLGAALFFAAHSVLPHNWFSHGGDWDLDPAMEAACAGLLSALAGFWAVYRLSWRRKSPAR